MIEPVEIKLPIENDHPPGSQERILNISGGRTSGYMLAGVLKAYDGVLPPNTRAIFTNTGKEREETLVFLKRMSEEWNVHITWLEYRYDAEAEGGRKDPKNKFVEVNFDTASRNGEPFNELISSRSLLPNVKHRNCTSELKVHTVRRYMLREYGIGSKGYRALLGIRYDEKKRVAKMIKTGEVGVSDCLVELPLFTNKVTISMIMKYWKESPFDLGISSDQGNCDLCFLKSKKKLIRLMQQEPERTDWWIDKEEIITTMWADKSKSPRTFKKDVSYAELLRAAENYGVQEYMFDDDDEGISCFCTD